MCVRNHHEKCHPPNTHGNQLARPGTNTHAPCTSHRHIHTHAQTIPSPTEHAHAHQCRYRIIPTQQPFILTTQCHSGDGRAGAHGSTEMFQPSVCDAEPCASVCRQSIREPGANIHSSCTLHTRAHKLISWPTEHTRIPMSIWNYTNTTTTHIELYLPSNFTVVMVELEPMAALKCFKPSSVTLKSPVCARACQSPMQVPGGASPTQHPHTVTSLVHVWRYTTLCTCVSNQHEPQEESQPNTHT